MGVYSRKKVHFMFKFYFITYIRPVHFRYVKYRCKYVIPEFFVMIVQGKIFFRGMAPIEKTRGIYIGCGKQRKICFCETHSFDRSCLWSWTGIYIIL